MSEHVETVIVGGGQAGLAVSYHLSQQGRPHTILEQASQPAEAWRNRRWDSFTLVTPNWMLRMPGAEYQGDDPEGFMPREEVVAYLEDYIERFRLPIQYGVRVNSVEKNGTGYLVHTDEATVEADNVVIATGLFQQPNIPAFSANLPAEVQQLHSSEYRNPAALPPGAVLVVGSAQSGAQIAEELYQSGRQVYLCVGASGRGPRHFRGKYITWRLNKTGWDVTVDKLPSPKAKFAASVQASGKDGGHTINLHQFARDGVVLLGRMQAAQGGKITLAPDLKENLAKVDKFEADLLKRIDDYIEKNGLDVPQETLPKLRDGYHAEVVTELDVQSAGITSVIWATGYRFDFGLVKLSVLDGDGYPIQKRGITDKPGLYFVGLPWLHTAKSGLLFGVGDDAAHIVADIAGKKRNDGSQAQSYLWG
ncbi:MAG: NAD(P)-binding domain-containing protein [Phycisphaerales bacterium]|nr:MAG: NAD(P)-binding domain-containing protein [Phycisphaerales bacterium]